MSAPYFYEVFDAISQLQLSEASMHHAIHVLRMKQGDELHVTNGKGLLVNCRISSIGKKNCAIDILSAQENMASSPKLHIAIAFTKNPSRMEWFLEKATEIGVHTITPLLTHRSEKTHFKKERFEKIMVSAMLQSQQIFLPILNEPAAFTEVLSGAETNKLIAHCIENEPRTLLKTEIANNDTLLLIGPEGDFSSEEIALSHQLQCKPVSLGNTRLRTETAGIFACVVFNAEIAAL